MSINYHVISVGADNTPVMVIDQFSEALRADILADVQGANFDLADTYYPGLRAKLPSNYVIGVIQQIYLDMYDVFGLPHNLQVGLTQAVYSLLTTASDRLLPSQMIPHVDGVSPHQFAVLHFLNNGRHGGTGFFRHRATRLERITRESERRYFTEVAGEEREDSRRKGYINSSDDRFELIGEVEYQPGRLIIYPGNLLHSSLVDESTDIDASLSSGRLTANIFLNFS